MNNPTAKAVMISIQSRWCAEIANGRKTVEVRKDMPKIEVPFTCYIYCTKKPPYLVPDYVFCGDRIPEYRTIPRRFLKRTDIFENAMNGQIIGEFICNKITKIESRGVLNNYSYCYLPLTVFGNDDIEPEIRAISKSSITQEELNAYGAGHTQLYAWRISDLKIYSQPKLLEEFDLKHPPQSWCYVDDK